jgi:hypothetical protein
MRMSNRSVGNYLRIPIHHKVSCAALVSHALNSCDSRNHVPVPSVRCSHTFACVMWKLREDNQSPKIRGFRGLAEATSELVRPQNSFLLTSIMVVLVAPDDVDNRIVDVYDCPVHRKSTLGQHLVELVSAYSTITDKHDFKLRHSRANPRGTRQHPLKVGR